jgi:hypothetical protein
MSGQNISVVTTGTTNVCIIQNAFTIDEVEVMAVR